MDAAAEYDGAHGGSRGRGFGTHEGLLKKNKEVCVEEASAHMEAMRGEEQGGSRGGGFGEHGGWQDSTQGCHVLMVRVAMGEREATHMPHLG